MRLVLLIFWFAIPMHAQLVDRETNESRELREQADEKVLSALAAHGADLKKPHLLEHHFIARSERVAKAISDFGSKSGYRTLHAGSKSDKNGQKVWFLDLARAVVPTKRAVFEETRMMTMIAHHFGAKYDGWGCDVEK